MAKYIFLYDGECPLCQDTIEFLTDKDHHGQIDFLSLHTPQGQKLLIKYGYDPDDRNQILLISDVGHVFEKSDVYLKLMCELQFGWGIRHMLAVTPKPLRDSVYDLIGRNRYLFWGWGQKVKPRRRQNPFKVMMRSLLLFLPVLVPSWRFFDGVAASPRIEYMVDGGHQWIDLCPKEDHIPWRLKISRLFYNPKWNDDLFMASCAERIRDGQVTHSEAEIVARISKRLDSDERFEFRLMFVNETDDGEFERHVIYQSKMMSAI